MSKQCRKCNEVKSLDSFGKRTATKDGFGSYCKPCNKVYSKAYREANSDKLKAFGKAYYEANSDRIKAKTKAWKAANPERKKATDKAWDKANRVKESARKKAWALANPDKCKAWALANPEKVKASKRAWYHANSEKAKANQKIWAEANPEKLAASRAKRRASKIQRTPSWLTPTQLAEIESFYIESQIRTRLTGIQYHVDHVVPLQGENISGLHVPWNLNVITAEENMAKGNRYET